MKPEDYVIGKTVYVYKSQNCYRLSFTPFKDAKQFFITEINNPKDEHREIFAEWTFMPLRNVIVLREHPVNKLYEDDIDVVYRQVASLVNRELVRSALENGSLMISPDKIGLTDERRSSKASILITVAERLQLCEDLSNHTAAGLIGIQQRNLVIYLLLTCFDRLGQPHQFSDFGSFLEAGKGQKKVLRDSIINSNLELDGVDLAKVLYQGYQQEFGVKNSFMKFIDNILDEEMRNKLASSIRLRKNPYRPTRGSKLLLNEDFEDIKKFLYQMRNNYTHKAEWMPGLTTPLTSSSGKADDIKQDKTYYFYDQRHEKRERISVLFKELPQTLFECIRYGMMQQLKALAVVHP